jgi:hypothetical protein
MVVQQRHSIGDDAATRRKLVRPEVPVTKAPLGLGLPIQVPYPALRFDVRRLMQVIDQRGRTDEPLVADQLLRVEASVSLPKRRVPLVRHVAEPMVDRR